MTTRAGLQQGYCASETAQVCQEMPYVARSRPSSGSSGSSGDRSRKLNRPSMH